MSSKPQDCLGRSCGFIENPGDSESLDWTDLNPDALPRTISEPRFGTMFRVVAISRPNSQARRRPAELPAVTPKASRLSDEDSKLG